MVARCVPCSWTKRCSPRVSYKPTLCALQISMTQSMPYSGLSSRTVQESGKSALIALSTFVHSMRFRLSFSTVHSGHLLRMVNEHTLTSAVSRRSRRERSGRCWRSAPLSSSAAVSSEQNARLRCFQAARRLGRPSRSVIVAFRGLRQCRGKATLTGRPHHQLCSHLPDRLSPAVLSHEESYRRFPARAEPKGRSMPRTVFRAPPLVRCRGFLRVRDVNLVSPYTARRDLRPEATASPCVGQHHRPIHSRQRDEPRSVPRLKDAMAEPIACA
jgi:hypothetical protein